MNMINPTHIPVALFPASWKHLQGPYHVTFLWKISKRQFGDEFAVGSQPLHSYCVLLLVTRIQESGGRAKYSMIPNYSFAGTGML